MPRFNYTARTATGQIVVDTVEAPNRQHAARLLVSRGLQPVKLGESDISCSRPRESAPTRLPRRRDFHPELQLPFLEALADLVGGGLPSGEAVRLLAQRLRDPRLQALSRQLWEDLSEGRPLSIAMQAHPRVFPEHTVNLVAAAEATGNLHELLMRLIRHYRSRQELRRTLGAALAYPLFICAVAFGVILFFVLFLLPRLQMLLNSLGGQLPWSTRLLVSVSDLTLTYGPFAAAGGVLTALAIWRWRKTPAGRFHSDSLLLRIPLAGRLATGSAIHDFSSTLAVLLENGITLAEALRMAERTIDNRALQKPFQAATDRILEGESLSQAIGRTGILPALDLDRLAVGESTGKLGPCLRGIASTYLQQLERSLHTLTRLLSTAVLLGAFIFVGFIAYAIVSAVFQVSASFKF